MKKMLPFVKGNILSLASILVALIAAPVLWFVSSGWHNSMLDRLEADVRKDVGAINAVDVTYQIPAYLNGIDQVSVKTAPNAVTTQRVKTLLEKIISESAAVRQQAIDFNSAGKALLVGSDGSGGQLFPAPSSESAKLRLLREMIETWPAAHEQLLEDFHAGEPPALAGIRTRLERDNREERARIAAGRADGLLTSDEQDRLAERLGNNRLQYYRNHAKRLSFFATPDIFLAVEPWDDTQVLPIETAWEWQHLYWVHQDIIRGVAYANRHDVLDFMSVHEAPVKRVLSVVVSEPTSTPSASSGGRSGRSRGASNPGASGEPQPASVDDAAVMQPNYTMSHTGRVSWPVAANPMFDIRNVDVELLVASSKLPQIIDAFGQVNFMTIVGLDLQEYDPVPDIALGFDYGADHIVKATLRIETIWLRSWLGMYMPEQVRTANGIPDPPQENEQNEDNNAQG